MPGAAKRSCEYCGTTDSVFIYHNFMTGELNAWCEDCVAAEISLARVAHEIDKDQKKKDVM